MVTKTSVALEWWKRDSNQDAEEERSLRDVLYRGWRREIRVFSSVEDQTCKSVSSCSSVPCPVDGSVADDSGAEVEVDDCEEEAREEPTLNDRRLLFEQQSRQFGTDVVPQDTSVGDAAGNCSTEHGVREIKSEGSLTLAHAVFCNVERCLGSEASVGTLERR